MSKPMPTINLVRHAQTPELSERWTRQPGLHFDVAIIVLGAVNVAAAFLMILVIGYDARGLAKMRTRALPRYHELAGYSYLQSHG